MIPASMAKDYYQILGLSRDASAADIKKAYRDLSKQWHPDKHKGDKSAEAKFKEINEAYEALGNPDKKSRYDQFGTTGGPQGGGFGGFDFSGFQNGNFEGGLGDIFESFFGGGGGGARRGARSERGRDLQIGVAVEFSDAVTGVRKTVTVERLVVCKECDGKGSAKGTQMKTCERCKGTGQITRTAQSFFGTIQQSVLCDLCKGAGKVPEKPCGTCDGQGRRRESSALTLDIPAGIDDGQTLRVTGQGEAGVRGAPAGDLYVEISVRSDKRFTRDGSDIKTDLHVRVPDAALGTDVSVETVTGKTTLRVPAGTQSGQVLRIKGKGMPVLNSSRFGDHYVRVVVDIPAKLSREEKKLMEEWRKMK
ncbi:molecular chaperone DnaJ [Candidatus Peregrinibacteria bacterium]|nr:molecular chaperone DnaJ [Candidatus Peregrinibacteria bacterium]